MKLTKLKEYTLTMYLKDDLTLHINAKCDGFEALELLGLLAWKQNDILEQLGGKIKPDFVERKIVKEKK